MEQDEEQEIFENTDKSEKMELESDNEEMDNTRPVQEILSELAQKTRDNLKLYDNAVTRLELVLKRIEYSGTVHINICGTKRKFREFIEECAMESKKKIKEANCMNFGELLLKGLQDSS